MDDSRAGTDERSRTLDALRSILVEDLRVQCEARQIDPDVALFGSGLGLDSIDAVDLGVAIDRRLGVRLEQGPRAREVMRTMASLADEVMLLRKIRDGEIDAEDARVEGVETSTAGDGFVVPRALPRRAPAHPHRPAGYDALRNAVGILRERDWHAFLLRGEAAFDLVDALSSRDVFVRPDAMLHTLFLGEDGSAWANVYLSPKGDDFHVLVSGPSHDEALEHLEAARDQGNLEVEIESLAEAHDLVGIHGPFAWELLEAIVGPEVIGIPYLSAFELFEFDARCFRFGETGEFGYQVIVPRERSDELFARLEAEGAELGVERLDPDALVLAGLESGFFQAAVPELRRLPAVELQLAWRLTLDREVPGMEAARRQLDESPRRIRWFATDDPLAEVETGASVVLDNGAIGEVVVARCGVGVALISAPELEDGTTVVLGDVAGVLRSAPLVVSVSLRVDPQRHRYASRVEDGLVDDG